METQKVVSQMILLRLQEILLLIMHVHIAEISVSSNGNYRNILQLLMDSSFDNVDSEPNG